MGKHTPGPWKVELNEKGGTAAVLGRRGDGNVRSADGCGVLFYVDCATRETADRVMFPDIDQEALANAHLAAAAPDMLEALREIAEGITVIGDYESGNAVKILMSRSEMREIASAALAKADS